MTFKEKWIQDHPGEEFHGGFVDMCPDRQGYEPYDRKHGNCPHPGLTCTGCWDREMPEDKAFDDAIARMADEAAKTGESIKKAIVEAGQKLANETTLSMEEAVSAVIKDSGDRTEFKTGAVRDMREGKGRCDLMPLEVVAEVVAEKLGRDPILFDVSCFLDKDDEQGTAWLKAALDNFADKAYGGQRTTMFLEVAKHFEEGAKKYGENNWQKGIPVHCYIDSAVRHYLKWLRGDKDEPHDRAFVWNIMCCIWEVDYHEKDTGVHNEDK